MDKIKVENLKDLVNDKCSQNKNIHDQELTNKLDHLRVKRTKIVQNYLIAISKNNIELKIIEALSTDEPLIHLYIEMIPVYLWYKLPELNRDDIVNTPLCDQDLNFSIITCNTSKSIIQMVKDIVPNDYRVSSMYGGYVDGSGRRYEITLRRGTICCNDPWCLLLCCFYKPLIYTLCVNDYSEYDPFYVRCCCSDRCFFGP